MRIIGPEFQRMLMEAPRVELVLRIGDHEQTIDVAVHNWQLDTEQECHPHYEDIRYIRFSLKGHVKIPVVLPTVATIDNMMRL